MTRYEQGFLTKCAEHGVGADAAIMLLCKDASAFSRLVGKGVNRLGRRFRLKSVDPNFLERLGSQLHDRGVRGTAADAGRRYWKNLSGKGIDEARKGVDKANVKVHEARFDMEDADTVRFLHPSAGSEEAYKDALKAYNETLRGSNDANMALTDALRAHIRTRLATGAAAAPFLAAPFITKTDN